MSSSSVKSARLIKLDLSNNMDLFLKYHNFELHDQKTKLYFRYQKQVSILVQLLPTFQITCPDLNQEDTEKLQSVINAFPIETIDQKKMMLPHIWEWIENTIHISNQIQCLTENDDNLVDGFTDSNSEDELDEYNQLPEIKHTVTRQLKCYVWGRKVRKCPPPNVQRNFNACILHGKKKGVDWRQSGKDSLEVRIAVMKCRLFPGFIGHIVEMIERDHLHTIAINCAKGRHRSATTAYMLKEYYPLIEIIYLEL